jgi:hypothetical protein
VITTLAPFETKAGGFLQIGVATTVTLVVNLAPTPDFSISAFPSSQTVTRGNSTTYAPTVTSINGFNGR